MPFFRTRYISCQRSCCRAFFFFPSLQSLRDLSPCSLFPSACFHSPCRSSAQQLSADKGEELLCIFSSPGSCSLVFFHSPFYFQQFFGTTSANGWALVVEAIERTPTTLHDSAPVVRPAHGMPTQSQRSPTQGIRGSVVIRSLDYVPTSNRETHLWHRSIISSDFFAGDLPGSAIGLYSAVIARTHPRRGCI